MLILYLYWNPSFLFMTHRDGIEFELELDLLIDLNFDFCLEIQSWLLMIWILLLVIGGL